MIHLEIRKLALLFGAFPVALVLEAGFAQQPTPVMTEYGLVQGAVEQDLTVYRGVASLALRSGLGQIEWARIFSRHQPCGGHPN